MAIKHTRSTSNFEIQPQSQRVSKAPDRLSPPPFKRQKTSVTKSSLQPQPPRAKLALNPLSTKLPKKDPTRSRAHHEDKENWTASIEQKLPSKREPFHERVVALPNENSDAKALPNRDDLSGKKKRRDAKFADKHLEQLAKDAEKTPGS